MTREQAIEVLIDRYNSGVIRGRTDDEWRLATDTVIVALREPAHEWVKTSDRLPEPWVTVLLWDGDEMVSGYAHDDGDLIEHRWGQVFRATHWMNLPEPPGEEVEG